MSLLKKIFGKKVVEDTGATDKNYYSKDNLGTRFRDANHAQMHWVTCYLSSYSPAIICKFDTLKQAENAILSLSYIHRAVDSDALISTKILEYGCYVDESGKGEVILCGKAFDMTMWLEAKYKFSKLGGKIWKENKPENQSTVKAIPSSKSGRVTFSEEQTQTLSDGQQARYKIYKGANKAAAEGFLKKQSVEEALHYIVVETPEGNFCRDKNGIYRE